MSRYDPVVPTPKQDLASIILKHDVADWLRERHDRGSSLRDLAFDLNDATKGKVRVSAETIRTWLR